jgi:hypothetical protein
VRHDKENERFIVQAPMNESLARQFEALANEIGSEAEALRYCVRNQLQREVPKDEPNPVSNPAERVAKQAKEAESNDD